MPNTPRTNDPDVLNPSILDRQRERILRHWLLLLNADQEFTVPYVQAHAPRGTRPGDVVVVIAAMVDEGLIVHVPGQPHGVYRLAVVEG